MKIIKNDAYKSMIKELKELIYKSQKKVLKTMNNEIINLYFEIGKDIAIRQNENGWGKSIVDIVSKELENEFPGINGFSSVNLWRMRNFYLEYHDNKKLLSLAKDITWSNNVIIIIKCKDNLEREFYMRMTKKYGWSKRLLANYIEAKTYENYLLNQTNFDETLSEEQKEKAAFAIKDEYSFIFTKLNPEYSEQELEHN